eukprot:TRINITY_DN5263_c0_g1_i3.p1 TRINITY_DN5263_c0_g1~~TRINITY_DN5263_c0_g1_i3.p1  ORF type:complete len:392 (+),score=58.38 TRINITY_DN5263_c0_g1_i3:69-1244(+)
MTWPKIGDKVQVVSSGRKGNLLLDDGGEIPFKVSFEDTALPHTDWFRADAIVDAATGATYVSVKSEPTATSIESVPKTDASDEGIEDLGSIEGFFRAHPDFPIPFLLWAALVFGAAKIPSLASWFEARDMQPWGLIEASKLAIFAIMCSFAIHGFVAAQHGRLMRLGLKVQKGREYDFQCEDTCMRSSMIYLSQLVYAVMPVRPVLSPFSGFGAFSEFFLGLSVLYIVGDLWFFVCHCLFHTKTLYQHFHKTHHKWKQPNSFSAYYIRSWTHLIQEHVCVFPLMMFSPIPLSAFLFYQYWGIFGAQVQHSGFNLDELRIPFCRGLKLGHVFTVTNPWVLLLGAQTIEEHDYHHEQFHGNFALSYKYLDLIFGTYVDPKKRSAVQSPLVSEV